MAMPSHDGVTPDSGRPRNRQVGAMAQKDRDRARSHRCSITRRRRAPPRRTRALPPPASGRWPCNVPPQGVTPPSGVRALSGGERASPCFPLSLSAPLRAIPCLPPCLSVPSLASLSHPVTQPCTFAYCIAHTSFTYHSNVVHVSSTHRSHIVHEWRVSHRIVRVCRIVSAA